MCLRWPRLRRSRPSRCPNKAEYPPGQPRSIEHPSAQVAIPERFATAADTNNGGLDTPTDSALERARERRPVRSRRAGCGRCDRCSRTGAQSRHRDYLPQRRPWTRTSGALVPANAPGPLIPSLHGCRRRGHRALAATLAPTVRWPFLISIIKIDAICANCATAEVCMVYWPWAHVAR